MRDEKSFTLMSPAAGFTARVMTRLAARERAMARRRAMLGSALLVGAAIIIVALIAWWMLALLAVFVTMPSTIVAVMDACGVFAFWLGVVLNALWVAVSVVAEKFGAMSMLVIAVIVCVLMSIWLRVVAGPTFASQTINLGGSR